MAISAKPDEATLRAYDRDAASFAEDWETQPAPTDLHATVHRFFVRGPTADIGCGSGRDTAWLNDNGYPATGFDASEGLLAEARRRHPHVHFQRAALPELAGIDGPFTNILCETVIMHLPPGILTASVVRMLSLLEPNGTLYLSWRVTEGTDRRDEHGRLYAAFDPALALTPLASAQILLDEQVGSISSGKRIRRIVARK
jgi:SAM-dependent methyltransferase